MKKLVLIAAAVLAICSCEKVYDEDEYSRLFGVIIDWAYFGYDEVYNKTASDITFSMFIPVWRGNPQRLEFERIDYLIKPDENISMEQREGSCIGYCDSLAFTLPNGSSVGLKHYGQDDLSRLFFDNYERTFIDKIFELDGHKIKRHLTVDKYFITDEIIK